MEEKNQTFRSYWKTEKAYFDDHGLQPSMDYPLLNDLINGMLFKSFEETLKSRHSATMMYNPQNNKFLNNFHLYLAEVQKEIAKTYQAIEEHLSDWETHLDLYFKKVKNRDETAFKAGVDQLFSKLMKIVKFSLFNIEVYHHLIKKINVHCIKLELKFEAEAFWILAKDETSNVFFGCLRVEECLHKYQSLLSYAIETFVVDSSMKDVVTEMQNEIKTVSEHIEAKRHKFLLTAPKDKILTFYNLFEAKRSQILEEVNSQLRVGSGDSNSWKLDLMMSLASKEDKRFETLNKYLDAPSGEYGYRPIHPPEHPATYHSKPIGDDPPIETVEPLEVKHIRIDEEVKLPKQANQRSRYFIDIIGGFGQAEQACYSKSAPWLVLIHTFLYMLLYYGITPTTYDYNLLMEIPKQYFGLVSAFTPFLAALSSFIYNYTTSVHYKRSYYFSIGCLIAGSFLYSLAFTYRSLAMLFVGRGLFGFGSGRILTRKFFTREIHIDHRTKWSAILVGVTSLSMTLGPGVSALLETLIDSSNAHSQKLEKFHTFTEAEKEAVMDVLTSFKIGGMRFCKMNYITMLSFLGFIVLLVVYILFFQDTPDLEEEDPAKTDHLKHHSRKIYLMSQIEMLKFLPQDSKSLQYSPEEKVKKLQDFKQKLSSAIKFFTDKQTYYIGAYFFVTKAIQECIIVESPAYIVRNYKYTSALSGLIFFLFTVFTLPAALTPSFLKKKFQDRSMLRSISIVLIGAMILKCQFTEEIYPFGVFIAGSCLVLGLSLAVETCCSSLLTKVISEKRAKSFMNAGLQAGLIDTLGRVTGSSSITVILTFADYPILNCILYPWWLFVFLLLVSGLIVMYKRLDAMTYFQFK